MTFCTKTNIVFTTIRDYVYETQPNNYCVIFYGRDTFQKSKSISGMESHGFLKTNKNQLTLYTYYYTTSDFSLTNIATFLLKNEYYLDFVNRYTTVDTSWVRITSPSGMHEFISCFLFSFGVDPFQFSILSIGKLCLPMSLSIIVFIMVSWFLAFDHLFVPSDDMQFHCRFRSDCYIIVRQ